MWGFLCSIAYFEGPLLFEILFTSHYEKFFCDIDWDRKKNTTTSGEPALTSNNQPEFPHFSIKIKQDRLICRKCRKHFHATLFVWMGHVKKLDVLGNWQV